MEPNTAHPVILPGTKADSRPLVACSFCPRQDSPSRVVTLSGGKIRCSHCHTLAVRRKPRGKG